MSQKFETQNCQWYGVKRIKSIFVDKGRVEQGLGQIFIILRNSFHFFNKIYFEQYLFKSYFDTVQSIPYIKKLISELRRIISMSMPFESSSGKMLLIE